jgi:hypothetical protein
MTIYWHCLLIIIIITYYIMDQDEFIEEQHSPEPHVEEVKNPLIELE